MFENPQALVALVVLGLIGFMLLISKIFTKLWLYALLLSPSWGISAYNIFNSIINGETSDILLNHASGLIFILAPIDEYLIVDPTLSIYGAVLLGIWFYIILITCKSLLGAWMLPVAPLIFWLLGRGLGNTMQLLTPYLPDWLLLYNGIVLVLMFCALIGIALFIYKIRKS